MNLLTYVFFVAGSLAFMSIGVSSGWASPSLVKLSALDSPIFVSNDELSWVASMLAVGGLTVSLPFSYFLNTIGRKPMIVVVALVYISGWLALVYSQTVEHLYVGRYLLGAAVGCTYGSVPVYIGEVVGQHIRGAIVTFLVMSQSIGALIAYVIGPIVSFHTLNCISIFVPCLMFVAFLMMPETPYFLMRSGKRDEAEAVLMKFRGCVKPEDVQEEMKGMTEFLQTTVNSGFFQSIKQLSDKQSRKIIAIIAVLVVGQQLSGVAALTAYMQSIFIETESPIPPNYAVILSEILADVSVLTTTFLMDRFGRKPLFAISAVTCIIFNAVLGIYFVTRATGVLGTNQMSWIPMAAIFLIRIGFDIGLAPVPMVVTSEILSYNIKGLGSSIFAFLQGASMAVVIKVFAIVKDEWGQQYSHAFFAIGVFAAMTFIIAFMPETKNKSLLEVQQQLEEKPKPSSIEIKEMYQYTNECV